MQWDLIVSFGIATEEELDLVTKIAGYTIEVLDNVVYTRTGYRDIEQFLEEN